MDTYNSLTKTFKGKHIILFDGVCNFCNSAVNFVIDRDQKNKFVFASLQSPEGKNILKEHHYDDDSLKTIVLLTESGELLTKSTAALYISRELQSGWRWLYMLRIVPRFLRDAVYNLIARYRYRLFGKTDQCRIPTPELRQRFLEG